MVKVTSTSYTTKGHYKRGNAKKANYKKGSKNVTKLSEKYERQSLKALQLHEQAGTECLNTIHCSPNNKKDSAAAAETLFSDWAAIKEKWNEFRVVYFSATVVFKSNESVVQSTIERDATPCTTTAQMDKSEHTKNHSLDGDNKKVFRAWQPSSGADWDFQKTVATADNPMKTPAYIKFLQANLANGNQRCEIIYKMVIQCRNRKNE